jgi:hypothetical protein
MHRLQRVHLDWEAAEAEARSRAAAAATTLLAVQGSCMRSPSVPVMGACIRNPSAAAAACVTSCFRARACMRCPYMEAAVSSFQARACAARRAADELPISNQRRSEAIRSNQRRAADELPMSEAV